MALFKRVVCVAASAVVFGTVSASAQNHLVIEASPDSTMSYDTDNPVGTAYINSSSTSVNLYAIQRDASGKWMGPANPVSWSSSATAIASVSAGTSPALGECLITKLGPAGTTCITASYPAGGLSAYADVVVEAVSYDAVGIFIQTDTGFTQVTTLSLRGDQDTLLYVMGQRADNLAWQQVSANWSISSPISAATPPWQSYSWRVVAADTGTAHIQATYGSRSATIPVLFLPGKPASMALYPEAGDPSALTPYGAAIQDTAGTTLPIITKVFDRNGVWLADYETVDTLSNRIVMQHDAGELASLGGSGAVVSLITTTAFRRIRLTASLDGQSWVSASMDIEIIAGVAYQLVIEPDSLGESVSPNYVRLFDTLKITSQETTGKVYAVLRDQFGNWVGFAQSPSWSSGDVGVVTIASSGGSGTGQATVTLQATGSTWISTMDGGTGMRDTTHVLALVYYYTAFRIVNGAGAVLDTLAMTSNEDTTLSVQGQRSDNAVWEPASGMWTVSLSLQPGLPAQNTASSWTLTPSSPGTGQIIVGPADGVITMPDTIGVAIAPGPPTRIAFSILTPDSQCIAGDTILGVVSIRNKDGLVPGAWCYSGTGGAVYTDMLSDGGRALEPTIRAEGVNYALNTEGATNVRIDQCFSNGLDTIEFVLTYAPADPDSVHSIVVMAGSLVDTVTIRLRPASIASIEIGVPVFPVDTLTVPAPYGEATLTAYGYDSYGNSCGPQKCNWSVSGTLYPVSRPFSVTSVYYASSSAANDGFGNLRAVAVADSTIEDSVAIRLSGGKAAIVGAYTVDKNGNGYLDGVNVVLSRPVEFPSGYSTTNFFVSRTMNSTQIQFMVNNIETSASVPLVKLFLAEDSTTVPGVLQTDWTLSVSLQEDSLIDSASAAGPTITGDSAGPVIQSVELFETVSPPRVVVIFSEPVTAADGSSLSPAARPEDVFIAAYLDSMGFHPGIYLQQIQNFTYVTDTSAEFRLTTGTPLTSMYYLKLEATGYTVADQSGNLPDTNNRYVRVRQPGVSAGDFVCFPIPATPATIDAAWEGAYLIAEHCPWARTWVQSKGGVVMSFSLSVPDSGSVSASVNIFEGDNTRSDAIVGAYSAELFNSMLDAKGVMDVDLIWSGRDAQGEAVQPGTYSAVINVNYTHDTYSDRRFTLEMLISNPNADQKPCGQCGSGVGLAFIPPVVYRLARKRRFPGHRRVSCR